MTKENGEISAGSGKFKEPLPATSIDRVSKSACDCTTEQSVTAESVNAASQELLAPSNLSTTLPEVPIQLVETEDLNDLLTRQKCLSFGLLTAAELTRRIKALRKVLNRPNVSSFSIQTKTDVLESHLEARRGLNRLCRAAKFRDFGLEDGDCSSQMAKLYHNWNRTVQVRLKQDAWQELSNYTCARFGSDLAYEDIEELGKIALDEWINSSGRDVSEAAPKVHSNMDQLDEKTGGKRKHAKVDDVVKAAHSDLGREQYPPKRLRQTLGAAINLGTLPKAEPGNPYLSFLSPEMFEILDALQAAGFYEVPIIQRFSSACFTKIRELSDEVARQHTHQRYSSLLTEKMTTVEGDLGKLVAKFSDIAAQVKKF